MSHSSTAMTQVSSLGSVTAVQYWRQSRTWSEWLGRQGVVIQSSLIRTAEPSLAIFAPYYLVVVEFSPSGAGVQTEQSELPALQESTSQRRAFLGCGRSEFSVGTVVECVWRRMAQPTAHSVIAYGIKVREVAMPESGLREPPDPADSVAALQARPQTR